VAGFPTDAPNHFDTKDFLLLYYSIIKDQFTNNRTYVLSSIFSYLKTEINPQMVEVNGIEPMASCVQGRRSPS
jgi:hypothetical protein